MYRWLRGVAVALSFLMASAATAHAQVIEQLQSDGWYVLPVPGQSFTATVDGHVTSIGVKPRVAANETLYLYQGTAVAIPAGNSTYSQAVTLPAVPTLPDPLALAEITLDTPFPVVAGQVYTFRLSGTVDLGAFGMMDLYTGGQMIEAGGAGSGMDLAFRVTQVAAPEPVPTLTEWAMIGLGVALAGGAAVLVQRRRTVRMAL